METERRRVAFDPALKHFRHGFRFGDPDLDSGQRPAFRLVEAKAMGHVLRCIAGIRWRDHLAIRGSATMPTWFGEAARPPKDLDFVVRPKNLNARSAEASQLMHEVVLAVLSSPSPVELLGDHVSEEDIWTYDRVPGMRLVFRWKALGTWGATQLDFVFGEELHAQVSEVALAIDGKPIWFPCASRELSLAWKLLWLSTDMHPQAKDLYDAVLLAESMQLERSLLEAVFQEAHDAVMPASMDFLQHDYLEWIELGDLRQHQPAKEWCERLRRAVGPLFVPAAR